LHEQISGECRLFVSKIAQTKRRRESLRRFVLSFRAKI